MATTKEMKKSYNELAEKLGWEKFSLKSNAHKKADVKAKLAEAEAAVAALHTDDEVDWNASNFMVVDKNGKMRPTLTLRQFAKAVQKHGDTRKVFLEACKDAGFNTGTAARQWQEVRQGLH